MKNILLKYGLISGLIVSVFMVLSMSSMTDDMPDTTIMTILGFGGMLVAFSLIFFAIKNYRKDNDNLISFGKAFQIGLYISLIASTMYVITWMIYYSTGAGDQFLAYYTNESIQTIEASGLDAATIEDQISKLKEDMKLYDENAAYRAMWTYMEILPVGLLVSLICAAILRRKNLPDSQ